MSSIVTLIPYKALPNDDLEEDYAQKHIKLGVGQQILGRGDFLSISDKRVSRSQATLTVEPEDDKMKIILKRLGMNAMFVVRNDGQWVPLEKEQDIELEDGDCFSMCVREFMFRIKVEHSDPKPPSQPAATQEDSQLHAKKSNETKAPQPVVEHKEVKQQAAEEPQEGWFIKKKKEPKSQAMEVEHKEHIPEHIPEHTNENNNQNKKHKQQENEVNEMKEQSSQDNDGKKNKRKITEEESDEEEFVEKVQKQIEKHQSTEDVSKNKKQKVVEVEDDAALARRLQKELEEEDNKAQQAKNKNKKKATNKPKHAEEDDEALAKRLQKELEQEEEEQLQKDAELAKSLAKKHKPSKGKKLAYQSGRPRRLCTMKKTKYEDDQVWSSEESWDEGEQDAASGGGSSDEAESWNSDDSLHENASQSGSDGEYKTASKKKTKPMCQFGAACYRTNPDHLKTFRHPKKKK